MDKITDFFSIIKKKLDFSDTSPKSRKTFIATLFTYFMLQ